MLRVESYLSKNPIPVSKDELELLRRTDRHEYWRKKALHDRWMTRYLAAIALDKRDVKRTLKTLRSNKWNVKNPVKALQSVRKSRAIKKYGKVD